MRKICHLALNWNLDYMLYMSARILITYSSKPWIHPWYEIQISSQINYRLDTLITNWYNREIFSRVILTWHKHWYSVIRPFLSNTSAHIQVKKYSLQARSTLGRYTKDGKEGETTGQNDNRFRGSVQRILPISPYCSAKQGFYIFPTWSIIFGAIQEK